MSVSGVLANEGWGCVLWGYGSDIDNGIGDLDKFRRG